MRILRFCRSTKLGPMCSGSGLTGYNFRLAADALGRTVTRFLGTIRAIWLYQLGIVRVHAGKGVIDAFQVGLEAVAGELDSIVPRPHAAPKSMPTTRLRASLRAPYSLRANR